MISLMHFYQNKPTPMVMPTSLMPSRSCISVILYGPFPLDVHSAPLQIILRTRTISSTSWYFLGSNRVRGVSNKTFFKEEVEFWKRWQQICWVFSILLGHFERIKQQIIMECLLKRATLQISLLYPKFDEKCRKSLDQSVCTTSFPI